MESLVKGLRPSKLDACIENITRTLAQRGQDESSQHSMNKSNFYRTEACGNSNEDENSIKIKIRKVGTYQTPDELKPYECPICHKKISNQANLRTHIRTHTGDKPHRCGICGKSFSRNGTLQTHLTIHSGVKLFKCEICGREIRDRGNLSKHMKIHLSNIIPKKETSSRNESQIYIPKTEMEVIKSFNAARKSLQNMNTSQIDMIRKEIYSLNNSQIQNLTKVKEQEVHEGNLSTDKVATINEYEGDNAGNKPQTKGDNPLTQKASSSSHATKREDNSSLTSASNLGSHFDNEIQTDKSPPFTKKNLAVPYESNKNSQDHVVSYSCGLCLISFSNTDSYFSHMMSHARDQHSGRRGPESSDNVEISSTKFKRPLREESAENQATPAEQEMFAAYEREMRAWDQRFNQRGHGFMDVQSKNTQLMKQQFAQNPADPMEREMLEAYERELKKYQDQKVKPADSIDDKRSRDSELKQDMGRADNSTGPGSEENLKQRSNFKCGICGSEYKTKDSFEDHITIHRVDKPYQCTICLEQFKDLRLLQRHIKGHRGLNPYFCEKCGKEFSQNIYLIEHLQTHAAENQSRGSIQNQPGSSRLPHPQQPQNQDMFIVLDS